MIYALSSLWRATAVTRLSNAPVVSSRPGYWLLDSAARESATTGTLSSLRVK